MPYTTITGLTIKVPTRGTKNWDAVLLSDTFTKIAQHKHTGSGDGNQMITASYADDSVSDAKVRLRNDQWLRSRNAADTANVNILRINSSDAIEFAQSLPIQASTTTTDLQSVDNTIASGTSTFHPKLIIDTAKTWTINGALFSLTSLTVNGTLQVNSGGSVRVI